VEDARLANLLGAHALRVSDRVDAAVDDATGLGPTQAAALVSLASFAEGEPQESLRAALDLSQPGAVRVVDRLAAAGLVSRRRGRQDGRQTLIHLTPKGRRMADRALAARSRALASEVDELSSGDRAAVTDALERLLAAATDGRATARRICRMCDGDACGHPARCPVTVAADACEAARGEGR
jgi:MarR family transcriptional regulator, negative regulator of the multidrug operon emrRAB